MKTGISAAFRSFGSVICAGSVLLLAATLNAQAQYNYTILSAPGDDYNMQVLGISGNNILGNYTVPGSGENGFLYNISSQTYTTLSMPGASTTAAWGIG